ncbi:hypothetical protein [Rhodococcus sp. ACT016]|uniref:hypothetical protein n=1 Tax=Rhodococcus sp. ACT016 TaxID=3134808 RepID=UPI003D2D8634
MTPKRLPPIAGSFTSNWMCLPTNNGFVDQLLSRGIHIPRIRVVDRPLTEDHTDPLLGNNAIERVTSAQIRGNPRLVLIERNPLVALPRVQVSSRRGAGRADQQPGNGLPRATACLWRKDTDSAWSCGEIHVPDDDEDDADGAEWLFRLLLEGTAEADKLALTYRAGVVLSAVCTWLKSLTE